MKQKKPAKGVSLLLTAIAAIGFFVLSFTPLAHAAGGVVKDPDGIAPDRYVYYPGTEALGKEVLFGDVRDRLLVHASALLPGGPFVSGALPDMPPDVPPDTAAAGDD